MRLINTLSWILITGSLSFNAFAEWYPSAKITQSAAIGVAPLRCPTIGKDYSQMISSLQLLQDQISKDANCGALKQELTKMAELGNQRRTEFLGLIEKAQSGAALSDNEGKQMVNYVEEVTMKASGLATLLTGSAQCFGEQDLSTSLFAVSSFVNEASTLLSAVAGPWGPALSIGGKVVTGLIQGVNRFIASLPGYDFKDEKDWQGYVETLCMFHEQQDEIQALIHPGAAISELSALNQKADIALKRLLSANPEGNAVVASFIAQDEPQLEVASQTPDGLKVVRLMTAQKWIQDRIQSIEKDASDPMINSSGRRLVQTMRDDIEDFLIARQGPSFIKFQNNDAQKLLYRFADTIAADGLQIYSMIQMYDQNLIEQHEFGFYMPLDDEILKNVMKQDPKFFERAGTPEAKRISDKLTYFRREMAKQWDAISLAYGVKVSFCEFFSKLGYGNSDILNACSSYTAKNVEDSIAKYTNLGIRNFVPPYLKTNEAGLNWAQSLEFWLDRQ